MTIFWLKQGRQWGDWDIFNIGLTQVQQLPFVGFSIEAQNRKAHLAEA